MSFHEHLANNVLNRNINWPIVPTLGRPGLIVRFLSALIVKVEPADSP